MPLVIDLTNPSPGIGWESHERLSLLERSSADTVMALALVHHLAIGNNLPLVMIAHFFQRICKTLIIEFIPKDDVQVKRMLSTREDIFNDYNQEEFERVFSEKFTIDRRIQIADSTRILYLMSVK